MSGLRRRNEMIRTVHAGGALAAIGKLEIGIETVVRGLMHGGIEESGVGILILGLLLNGMADLLEGFVGGEIRSLLRKKEQWLHC